MRHPKYEIVVDRRTAALALAHWFGVRVAVRMLADDSIRRPGRRVALPSLGMRGKSIFGSGVYSTRKAAESTADAVEQIAAYQAGRLGWPWTQVPLSIKYTH